MDLALNIDIWNDLDPRSGDVNMAIDQHLLETITVNPLLRFYSWDRPSVSFGYFETLSAARASFKNTLPILATEQHENNLSFIRRWTGGGIVDHRIDLTYTIVIPRHHMWAKLRGAESYKLIHIAAAKALNSTGTSCQLTTKNTGDGAATCFTNPVTHDIMAPNGKKLAGAGQKRTKQGLLHQGSIVGISNTPQWKLAFTKNLAKSSTPWEPTPTFLTHAHRLATTRYATKEWLEKRI